MVESFGDRLKELRKSAGVTQSKLAETLGVHLQTVSKWERGVCEPDLSVLGEIASALGVTLEKLLGQKEGECTYAGAFDAAELGKALAAARRAKGDGQDSVAAAAGASSDIVSKWERGIVCPDMRQLCALSEYFSVPVSKLYYGITDEVRTETPVQARRRKRFSFWFAGAGALVCAALVCLAVFLPKPGAEARRYTVNVDGTEYEVSSSDWFAPQTPEKEGYDFVGFVDGSGDTVSFPVKITQDAQFTAVFSPKEYSIDYWLNGGAFVSDAPHDFTVESGVIELSVPYKSGGAFEGWYLSPDFSGSPVERVECAACDIKLYAKWDYTVYAVRYELCGGTIAQSNPSEVTAEKEILLYEPIRKGYDFLGWFDAPSGGTLYDAVGGENARNLTLYARWQENGGQYSVTYHAGGGTMLGDNPVSVGAGEAHALFGARKAGYDFVGWNTRQDGGGEWVGTLYGIREDLELYAVYEPQTYTVVYSLDGGTYYKGENPNKIVYGERVDLLPVAKKGYTFVGWFDAKSGGNEIRQIDETNIFELTTVYARFALNEYKITLDGAGGVFDAGGERVENYTFVISVKSDFSLPEPTLAGYEFIGWYDEGGEQVESIGIVNIADMRLTAKYRPAGQTYAVTYVLGGGTQSDKNPTEVAWGQVVYFTAPTREGFKFLGWCDAADGSGTYYEATPEGREKDLTLYAIWQEILISGSAEDFTYAAGNASVTITGYTGAFGENIDLVIPSYIDAKPVVAVEGRFNSPAVSSPRQETLHSITIPDTVERLGEKVFGSLQVEEEIVIPASVKEIGENCFSGCTCTVSFAENSALKEIGEQAFRSARLNNILVLPEGVEMLRTGAFSEAVMPGIVLPDTLSYIAGYALGYWVGDSNMSAAVYLPKSVEFIESDAFGVSCKKYIYTPLTPEQTQAFSQQWDANAELIRLDAEVGGITLDYGDKTEYLAGQAFVLPIPQKGGCNFEGWYDLSAETYAAPLYIPKSEGVVLRAAYMEKSDNDGSSLSAPMLLEAGRQYEFILAPNEAFYFFPQEESGHIRIVWEGEVQGCPWGKSGELLVQEGEDRYGSGNFCQSGVSFFYERGTLLKVVAASHEIFYHRVTIRVERVA